MSDQNTHTDAGSGHPPPPPPPPTSHLSGSHVRHPTPRRKRKRPWFLIITTIVLLAITATLGWGLFYTYETTQQWQARSESLTDRVQDLANDIATLDEDLHATEEALARTETQLDNARDRITELADEKAQLGDEHAVQQRLVEYQEHVSEITADVLFVLDECIGGQSNLIEYLKTPENYDEDDLKEMHGEVRDYCDNATDIAEDLKTELAQ